MPVSTLVSDPVPAVTLAEAKAFYRILHDFEDDTVQRTIDAATERAAQVTNRTLTRGTYEMSVESFAPVELDRTPLGEIVSITYEATDGTTGTITDYTVTVSESTDRATITFDDAPDDLADGGMVTIRFTAGYDPTPSQIVSYILTYGLTLFEHRERLVTGTIVTDTAAGQFDRLLDSHRVYPL